MVLTPMPLTSFTEQKAGWHMDYRSTDASDRRRDLREARRRPGPATEQTATGANMTDAIHRRLFSDYTPTAGPR
ncbi:hypothetical protein NJ76_23325 [Rhodococcus sp. IITR03]|nr:hypothetical protein NJ76_23325 [Rhodococcus sp. IITR03]